MNAFVYLAIGAAVVATALGDGLPAACNHFGSGKSAACVLSEDCNDNTGMTVCYQQWCYHDLPCNKDNDCDFWEAADIYKFREATHRCYSVPNRKTKPHYGWCVMNKVAVPRAYKHIPGDDVQAVIDRDE